MPIQIDQKFPRCQLCGKIIPLRAERIEVPGTGSKPVRFCSVWCRDEYARRHQADPAPVPVMSDE
jgi:hypothetical protein